MKRVELRERKELGNIFYTMIKSSPSFPLTIANGGLLITISAISVINTVFPTYIISVTRNNEYNYKFLIKAIISVNTINDSYYICAFESMEGLKGIKEVLKKIKSTK